MTERFDYLAYSSGTGTELRVVNSVSAVSYTHLTQAFIYASIVKDMEEKKEAIDQILRVLTGENNDG